MPRVGYAMPQQGFRPRTNPLGALSGMGLAGLGADSGAGCDEAWSDYHASHGKAHCQELHEQFLNANPHLRGTKHGWHAFVQQYPDCASQDVWADFLESHPGCVPKHHRGMHGLAGLGADNTFSGCVSAVDASGNSVSCGDPSAAVWFDANMNAVAPGTQASGSGSSGVTTGSLLQYQGTWQVTPTLNVNTIISRVSQAVKAYGLQVASAQTTGGAVTLGNFNVSFALQVTGSGFAQPSDAGAIVDHAYYTVVGRMPVASATALQSGSYSSLPSIVPSSNPQVSTTPTSWFGSFFQQTPPQSTSQWLQNNAWWIGLGVVAVVILPGVVKKL
jgi:hypothetical protein